MSRHHRFIFHSSAETTPLPAAVWLFAGGLGSARYVLPKKGKTKIRLGVRKWKQVA